MTDKVNDEAPVLLTLLNNFINLNIQDGKEEALVYALSQLLHDRITALEEMGIMSEGEKGALVSTLIDNFFTFNKESLAIHKEEWRAMMESKSSTIH